MSILTAPDDLTLDCTNFDGTDGDGWFDYTTLEIGLDPAAAGSVNLTTDGIAGQALFSCAKKLWHGTYDGVDDVPANGGDIWSAYPFPFEMITATSGELVGGWDFAGSTPIDKTHREFVKSFGWNVRDTSGNLLAVWSAFRGLGDLSAVTTPATSVYLDIGEGSGTVQNLENGVLISDTVATLPINEAFCVYRDDNGDGSADFDYRSNDATLYVREFNATNLLTFSQTSTSEIGETGLTNILYSLPLQPVAVDTKQSDTYANVFTSAIAPYNSMSIEFNASAISRSLSTNGPYNFGVEIDANGGTLEQVYTWLQAQLLQAVDIDETSSGAVQYGHLIAELLFWIGDTLYTQQTDTPDTASIDGVYITNFNATQTGNIVMADNTGTDRTFPTLAPVTYTIGANGTGDTAFYYRTYFATADGFASNPAGTASAHIVQDSASNDMAGLITAETISSGVFTRTYAYDSAQDGGGAGQDRVLFVAAIGLATGQYVSADNIALTSAGASVSLVPALERNYVA